MDFIFYGRDFCAVVFLYFFLKYSNRFGDYRLHEYSSAVFASYFIYAKWSLAIISRYSVCAYNNKTTQNNYNNDLYAGVARVIQHVNNCIITPQSQSFPQSSLEFRDQKLLGEFQVLIVDFHHSRTSRITSYGTHPMTNKCL